MSYADEVFIRNCRDILTNGVWDTDQAVRPRWEDDGAPVQFFLFQNILTLIV